ncbi:hypothetical protein L484_024725 [Morus notabilis]|uniref:Uncharacterized protein n=1 Tax=Morus notabilis TaxID=981085 RepID=W9RFD7_9ROSA|nr:hypothetical protein L484_024725 [Morus notabilis]
MKNSRCPSLQPLMKLRRLASLARASRCRKTRSGKNNQNFLEGARLSQKKKKKRVLELWTGRSRPPEKPEVLPEPEPEPPEKFGARISP